MGFMTKLSQALRNQIMSPIGRPVSAIGVRPMLREPGIDIVGEKSIFGQPNPFGTPIPPARSPLQNAFDNIQKQIPQRPPSIGGIGGINQPINQPLQPVLQQPQPPQTGGIPVTGGGPLGSGILPIANLPTGPVSPPTNIGIQIPDNPVGGISAVPQPIPQVPSPVQPIFTTDEPIDPANRVVGGPVPMPSLADLSMPKIITPDGPPLAQVTAGSGITPTDRGRLITTDAPGVISAVPQPIPQVPQPLEKMPLPPKRDDFMSIGGPGGGFTDTRQAINPETGQPYTPVIDAGPDLRRDDFMSIGGPGGGFTDNRTFSPVNRTNILPPLDSIQPPPLPEERYGTGKMFDPVNLPEGYSFQDTSGNIRTMVAARPGFVYAYGPDGDRISVPSGAPGAAELRNQ